jgi:DASS family divalent anion:Na+ symporter
MESRQDALQRSVVLRELFTDAAQRLGHISSLILAATVGVAVWNLSPPAPLDAQGVHFLATLAVAVSLWVLQVFDDYLVGLMLLLSWLVLDVVPPDIALSGFSKSSWFFALSALGMGAAVNKSGVLHRIATNCLRCLTPNYKLYNWTLGAFGLFITPLVPEVKARILLVVPLAKALSERIGFSPRSDGAAGMSLSTYSGSSQMTFMFLTGSTYCLIGWSVLPEAAKAEFDWSNWVLAALPAGIVFFIALIISILAFFPIGEADKANFVSQTESIKSQAEKQPLRRDEWLTVVILSMALLGWVSKPLHGIHEPWIAFGALLAFAAAGILDRKTLKNNVDWPLILFFGVVYSMGGICTYLHVDQWLANVLAPVFSVISLHPLSFLITSLIVVYFIRFFLVKAPAVILAMLLFLPASSDAGIHPGILLITILLGVETWILPSCLFEHRGKSVYPCSGTKGYAGKVFRFFHRGCDQRPLLEVSRIHRLTMKSSGQAAFSS